MKKHFPLILMAAVALLALGACGRAPAAPAATATTVAKMADATATVAVGEAVATETVAVGEAVAKETMAVNEAAAAETAAVTEADAAATQAAQSADATATQEVAATQEATATVTVTATAVPSSEAALSAAPRTDLIRASELTDYKVYNLQDEELGTVHDLIVGRGGEDLTYAVVSVGGFLGIGDKLHLVPWRFFTMDQTDKRLILNMDPLMLKDAPAYNMDDLPVVTDPNWDVDIVKFWETIKLEPAAAPAVSATQAITSFVGVIGLNELADYSVKDAQGQGLGSIEDILINPLNGHIEYMILSFGGFLDIGDKWFAIPLNATELDTNNRTIVLDVTPDMLKAAPGFNHDELPGTADPNWDQEIRDYWQRVVTAVK